MLVPRPADPGYRGVRSAARIVTLASVASVAVTLIVATTVLADPWWKEPPAAAAPAMQPLNTLEPFDATGLPAGPARGIPQRATLPAGFNLKHVHGGPSYVYVIAGSLDIIDSDGSTKTYRTGDFFWEPVGRVHTAQTSEQAELFILRFLTPGAEGTVQTQ
jgi:hypothetical protein